MSLGARRLRSVKRQAKHRPPTAAALPIRCAAVKTNAMCSQLAPMWSCPHLPLLTSQVETSNLQNAENQGTLRHSPACRKAHAAKAQPQRKSLSHIYKRKTHGRNAEYAGIPDRDPHQARSFRQNKFREACDIAT